MNGTHPNVCPHCVELQAAIAALTARVEQVEAENARLKKNSSTSSKPPSSDVVKPKRPARDRKAKRKQGGQPGHARRQRADFPVEQVDEVREHRHDACPDCGGPVEACDQPPRVLQQAEVPPRPVVVVEHRGLACYCGRCRKTHVAPIPESTVRAGLVGPRLSALAAYLKGACHASFSTIQRFFRDVVGLSISRGQLAKIVAKASAGLDRSYEQLLERLPDQPTLNVDETGHKDQGRTMWTWAFRAELFTLFKIAPSRGSAVLVETLGRGFRGVLGCDYFSAYRKYMGECDVRVQFCLAHLIRDLKFLAEHPEPRNRSYGRRVLEAVRRLFEAIHRREAMKPRAFQNTLRILGDVLVRTAVADVPPTREARNLARRFEKHGSSYIRFVTTPGVEPTNNLAEQAIRFVVIDRRVTQGSRSETGRRWLERIWTAIATCARQGRSVFDFLHEAVLARFHGVPGPTLVPNAR